MSTIIAGVVTNGFIVPASPLKEGSRVQIHVTEEKRDADSTPRRLSISEIRRLPPEEREPILAAAAELAEDDYLNDKELTGAGSSPRRLSPTELRRLPRDERRAILAASAALAEEIYRSDKDLTGFDAFSEEFDDESD